MAKIHPTALVDPQAELADDVEVGPYAVIGPHVRVGARSSIGAAPQDKKYAGEPTRLSIGDRNTIREFCTFNCGTVQDSAETRVGHDNWIMAYVHLAHDVQLGSQCILANNATLAGHVQVGDWAIVGGLTGVHQFSRIGPHVMVGFQAHVSQDVPPFMTVAGNPLSVHGVNAEGLRRRGFSAERIALVKRMHRLLYRQGLSLDAAVQEIGSLSGTLAEGDADVRLLLDFLVAAKRGIVR